MSILFPVLFFITIPNGLVLRKHSGELITSSDLGAIHNQHHIKKYFSETLHPSTKQLLQISLSTNADTKIVDITNPIINPVDYGADPTGITDSTAAFQAALKEALSRGAPNISLADGIYDCGGSTIFLGGGDYLLSETLFIPPYYGNIRITDGTIRANKNFSSSAYMIQIGDETENCTTKQGSCNEYINIDHLFCDCKQICYGCIHIIDGMSTDIGPQVFFLGFNYAGITSTKGHSLFLINGWFGEYLYSDKRKSNFNASTATAINLNNPDNLINDVIVFSSRVGVNITGPASVLTNVHTWNLATHLGGIGIIINGASAHCRLINCYLDYNDLVIYTPIKLVSIENSLFLGSGTIRLVAKNNGIIDGLSIFDNQYNKGNGSVGTIELDETEFTFAQPNNLFIKNTQIMNGYVHKSSRVSKRLSEVMATQWKFNFTDELLFVNNVGVMNHMWVEYTFQFDAVSGGTNYKQTITHWVNPPNKGIVIVETNQPTNATVYMTVDESFNFQY